MPTYSQRFVREDRALPDWTNRPVCRELFPPELLETIDDNKTAATLDGNVFAKRRKLELSSVSALPSAEEAFGLVAPEEEDAGGISSNGNLLLERLEALRDDEAEEGAGGAGAGADVDDEEGLGEDEEDEVYDDEDAGDYDAENYFDNGDEFGEDYGDGDDGEGTF